MDYKNTINLPNTTFSMKANLGTLEPNIANHWQSIDIYQLIREKSKGLPKFILHDGPPYANGNIHIGHALNKILKDIIIKYKTMKGFNSPYVPGWDCHGLPVEHQLFKELNITKYQISKVDFRKKAFDYALRYVNIQKDEFKRLGVFGDWDNPYLTLAKEYETSIVDSFLQLVKKGFIYRGLKPVNWCPRCETALAEAEVEYNENHESPSVFVKFKISEKSPFKLDLGNIVHIFNEKEAREQYIVIWTTTPWTLISNVAVAVHPDFKYKALMTRKGIFIIAEDLLDGFLEKLGLSHSESQVVGHFVGKDLQNIIYKHPMFERQGRVVLADYVSKEEGTGCVHIAPGHGQQDYEVGLSYKLDVIMPVDGRGRFDATTGEFKDLSVFDANEKVINRLKELNLLLYSDTVRHSYPYCWRCKKPLITRSTSQWFVKVDNRDLRKKTLETIKKIAWIPSFGENRISGMVDTRPDWCLSRQRFWGVPIPAVYCKGCNEAILDLEVIQNFKKEMEKAGSDVWFIKDVEEFLPNNFRCPKCSETHFAKEEDILDVWFDSGVSHQAVLKKRNELSFPSDMYLEGSDQHRGWFQSALLTSMAIEEQAPFRAVLTHGFVVDGEGRKMSKSLGNVISPQEIIKNYGADILRLWVASCDYNDDVRISSDILQRCVESYRKIRNTFRFLLGNLYDFDPKIHQVSFSKLDDIDKWALSKLMHLLEEATSHYENYEFHKIYHKLYNFCVNHMSSFYLDVLKDRLYTSKADSLKRRSSQTVMYHILVTLEKMIAPILVYTTEEIWMILPKEDNLPSVHASGWPILKKEWIDLSIESIWDRVIEIRTFVLKAIEIKRAEAVIGNSLEATIELFVKDQKLYEFLKGLLEELPFIFIVSSVKLEKVSNLKKDATLTVEELNLAINVSKAKGNKCQRCWNWSESVGNDSIHPTLCKRCIEILN